MADLQLVGGAEEALEEASQPFVRRWNGLVSTTNWEKGKIIFQWREALVAAGAPPQEYSDEAWARRVGTVSSQHVGRLRRVHERFAPVREQFAKLYWSHFQAALDWPDPELWLEGAVQNGWSVADMRRQRWEAYGAPAGEKPRDADIIAAEFDEDVRPADDGISPGTRPSSRATSESGSDKGLNGNRAAGPDLDQGPDFGDEPIAFSSRGGDHQAAESGSPHSLYLDSAPIESIRPFEHLPELPADLAEALEMFKLSILRHKLDRWSQVGADDVLLALDGLKQLVLAPAE